MEEHEIARIAAMANGLRPDWPAASIATLIRGSKLASMVRRDVAVALAWIGCDPQTQTPRRVLESGPWWQATGGFSEGGAMRNPHAGEACAICQRWPHQCVCTDDSGKRTGPTRHRPTGVPPDPGLRAHMRSATRAARTKANPDPGNPPGSSHSQPEETR